VDYSLIIRKAIPEDAEGIWEVLQESFKKYADDVGLNYTIPALMETTEDIRTAIKTKDVIVALLNGTPVGTLRLETNSDKTVYLTRFGVRLQYHNVGIGQTLMSVVDNQMISKGIKRIYLHTASKNSDLVRFYYGRGFYVLSTGDDRGYIRALMVKDY